MGKRPISIDDLFELHLVNEPHISPEGQRVVFSVTQLDKDGDRYRAAIWVLDLESGEQTRLTSGRHRDDKPRWSPDGRWIAFTSDREDDGGPKGQLWLLSAEGGEPTRLTSFENSVEDVAWSPDSQSILLVTQVRQGEKPATDVKVLRSARFRVDGNGWVNDLYRQIMLVDVETGDHRQLTDGPYEHRQPAWSPNGYEIALSSSRRERWEFHPNRDIYLLKLESGAIRQVTDGQGAWGFPAFSPDGTRIACYGSSRLDTEFPRTEIFIVSTEGGEPESITADFDRSFTDGVASDVISYSGRAPVWLDGGHVAAIFSDRGAVRPAIVGVDELSVRQIGSGAERLGCINITKDGFICCQATQTVPSELIWRSRDGRETHRLTSFNEEWRAGKALVQPEEIVVESEPGVEVHCWLMRPPDFEEGKQYPLLLQIHGGPFGMYGESMMHEYQLLASQGYLVLYTNPRGSIGYGDSYAEALEHRWGEVDMPDLMAAVDAVIARGIVDESRMGVLGGSYGGFMTNWVIGHTDRFAAAVTMRTVTDLISAFGTDDIFYADNNATFGGTPWEVPDVFGKYSPITYVDSMRTPLLIIHSEEDYRCPIGQSEQLFTALKRLGREVEFLRVPDESHSLSRSGKPSRRVARLEHIVRWLNQYLCPEAGQD